MMVTTLYRMFGEPSVEGLENPFEDVPQSWYSDAVIWAVKEGLVKGVSETLFAPEASITLRARAVLNRAQMAKLLMLLDEQL